MPVSQGSAGGLPGLNLKAWAQVSAAGALLRGFNVSGVNKPSAGQYGLTLTAAVGSAAVVKVTPGFVGYVSGAGGGANISVTSYNLSQAAQDVAFYVEVYD